MYTPQNHRHILLLTYVCLAILSSWSSRLVAHDLATVPLTKATPESQNLSGARLEDAVVSIESGAYGDINSLLVVRNNFLVLEKYFSPEYHGREYVQPFRSTTKSVTSALIGIAVEQGKIASTQKPLLEFFPEYDDLKNVDSRKKLITLEQALTMTSGLQWAEFPYSNPQGDIYKMPGSSDWIRYVLDKPMSDSSADFVYSSGGSVLLSGILKNATGQSAEAFAIEHLFKPLDITKWYWAVGAKGITNTGWGLSMRRLDMARIGILFLNEGCWLGKQVISKQWQQISTRSHVNVEFGEEYPMYEYGYQWWRFKDDDATVSELATNDVYFSWGYGGQFVFVIPHLMMVVVSTGDNYGTNHRLFFDVLRDHIFPAVLD